MRIAKGAGGTDISAKGVGVDIKVFRMDNRRPHPKSRSDAASRCSPDAGRLVHVHVPSVRRH